MLDTPLRPLKDTLTTPLTRLIPPFITPTQLTLLAFLSGLTSLYLTTTRTPTSTPLLSLLFWTLNRLLDSLDGTLARLRGQTSDLGGFLDLLGDFIVYSGIPIACGVGSVRMSMDKERERGMWLAICTVEASFHVNNFVLFYVGAVVEKRGGEVRVAEAVAEAEAKAKAETTRNGSKGGDSTSVLEGQQREKKKKRLQQLTSVAMRPALIEGFESAVLFTVMLARPDWTEWVCWGMAGLVGIGICQRVRWVVPLLR